MNYPQTTALELTPNMESIGKYACLAFCYIFCAGIDSDNELEYIKIVNRAIKQGLLETDCTVKDANAFLEWLTGRKAKVNKKTIISIEEIKEATPVRFVYQGAGHWVVVENGKIVFNSLMNSNCVNKGFPTESRPINWQRW